MQVQCKRQLTNMYSQQGRDMYATSPALGNTRSWLILGHSRAVRRLYLSSCLWQMRDTAEEQGQPSTHCLARDATKCLICSDQVCMVRDAAEEQGSPGLMAAIIACQETYPGA